MRKLPPERPTGPRYKINLAFKHLKFAAYNSKNCKQIEDEHGVPETRRLYFDRTLPDNLASHCIACLWFCSSSLESYVNEVFQDRLGCFPEIPQNDFQVIYNSIERSGIVRKLSTLLKIKNVVINHEIKPWQSLKLMKDVRNSLIHFDPQWSDEDGKHKELAQELKNEGVSMPEFYQNNIEIWYPFDFFGYGFCEWSIRTVFHIYDVMEAHIKYFGNGYNGIKNQIFSEMK